MFRGGQSILSKWAALLVLILVASIAGSCAGQSQIDLVVTDIKLRPSSPAAGENISVQVTILNQGDEAAPASHWQLMPYPGASMEGVLPGLAPGEEVTMEGYFSLNESGTINVTAVADPRNKVRESAEDNNERSQALTLGEGPPDLPYLALNFSAGAGPYGICFDGENIWVSNNKEKTVIKMRASDGKLLGTFPVAISPRYLLFDGENIWVESYEGYVVTKLRASDGKLLGNFPIGEYGGGLRGICFDGENIWLVSHWSSHVIKMRASDGEILGTFPVGEFPQGVYFDGENIWVANVGGKSITKLRPSDGEILDTFPVGQSPRQIAFDGENLWVTDTDSNTVIKIRPSDGKILNTLAMGNGPIGIVFDGKNMWVSNVATPCSVIKFRPSDGQILGTIAVGLYPRDICFDGENIWTANFVGNSVTKATFSD